LDAFKAPPVPKTEEEVKDNLEIDSGKAEASLKCMAYSSDGQTLAVGDRDGQIRVFKPTAGLPFQQTINAHEKEVVSLSFNEQSHEESSLLISGSVTAFWFYSTLKRNSLRSALSKTTTQRSPRSPSCRNVLKRVAPARDCSLAALTDS